jgi:peptidoglycan/xylan/chitin deacetylase (PgdA/CDA1 family)
MRRGVSVLDRGIVSTRNVHGCVVLAALALAAGTAGEARAGWTTPAAGPTASGDPEVVLTFDDGPNPQTTPKVLDALKAHKVHAIFFLVGDRLSPENTAAHALVKRMLAEGHVVANHTVTHPQMCGLKEEALAAEIDGAATTITSISGMAVPWFRTPYGAFCRRVEAALAERHIMHWYWDIDSQEWRHNNAKRAYGYITASLNRLQSRAVVLMHDTKIATAKALPQVLDWLVAENKKRDESTRRQIRIIEPYQIAKEHAAPGLVDWIGEAATAGLATVTGIVTSALP